jgi:alpha-beta hydrolase superfamily lysophospholipase
VLSSTFSLLLLLALAVLLAPVVLVAYLIVRYTPIISRIFEEKPMFLPLRVGPTGEGEEVRFKTADGLELAGTYLKTRAPGRSGVLVFCHEFLSDRWSYHPYAEKLRDLGFDIFTFDFRNHGSSASDPVYEPLQWVSDHEVRDLEAALGYLRARGDRDPAGLALYGISKGGGAALAVAASQPDVWGLITDGAFPTSGTMFTYILRWAEIFVRNRMLYAILRDHMPHWVFAMLGSLARRQAERRLSCRFPEIESAAARLAPRPWLMIHGAKDAYIGPEIAQALFARAREPKELWIVPGAKHNRCREVDADAYAGRIESFLGKYAPRCPAAAAQAAGSETAAVGGPLARSETPATAGATALPRGPLTRPAGALSGGLATSISA